MRCWILLLLLAGCEEQDCGGTWLSDVEHQPIAAVAGDELIALTWTRRDVGAGAGRAPFHSLDAATRPDYVHAMVLPDGSVASTFDAPTELHAVVGKTTVLWRRDPFELTLQTGGGAKSVPMIPSNPLGGGALVFDGERYHAFWVPEYRALHHRSIAEDGTVGPLVVVEGLPPEWNEPRPVSDGNGTMFLLLGVEGYFVDLTTGSLRRVFVGDATVSRYELAFWFAGEFHILDSGRLFSIDASENVRTRFLEDDLRETKDIVVGTTRLFIRTPSGIVEVDGDLKTVRHHDAAPIFTVLGDDLLRFDRHELDEHTRTPGRIELRRGDTWTREIATDTPVRFQRRNCRS